MHKVTFLTEMRERPFSKFLILERISPEDDRRWRLKGFPLCFVPNIKGSKKSFVLVFNDFYEFYRQTKHFHCKHWSRRIYAAKGM